MDELKAIRARLIDARKDVDETVALFKTLPWPKFERETEYVALSKPDEYAFIDGTITTTDGGKYHLNDYRKVTNEKCVEHSSAKHTAHKRDSYMVGALARFNVNYKQLNPKAKEAADALGIKPICTNPYLNTVGASRRNRAQRRRSDQDLRRIDRARHQEGRGVQIPGQGR